MGKKQEIITLDGPSGVGKSTISRKIATLLGYAYLDTGAMYRAVGYYLRHNGVDVDDVQAVADNLDNISLHLLPAEKEDEDTGVVLNNVDISKEIRTSEIAMLASKVSAYPPVRVKLTQMQREIGVKGRIVAEGRDVGTVVFPDAAYKFFLEADIEERTRRRALQMNVNDDSAARSRILEMIRKRDRDDSERSVAPLKMADDAFRIDTTKLSIDDVCEIILHQIRVRQQESG